MHHTNALTIALLVALVGCGNDTTARTRDSLGPGHYRLSVAVPDGKDTLRIRGAVTLRMPNDSTIEGAYYLEDPAGKSGISATGRIEPAALTSAGTATLQLGRSASRLEIRRQGESASAALWIGNIVSEEFGSRRTLPASLVYVRPVQTQPMIFALSYSRANGQRQGRYDGVLTVVDEYYNVMKLEGELFQFERDTVGAPPFRRVARTEAVTTVRLDDRGIGTFTLPLGNMGLPVSCVADSLGRGGMNGKCQFGTSRDSDIAFELGSVPEGWEVGGFATRPDKDGDTLKTLIRPSPIGQGGVSALEAVGTYRLFESIEWPSRSGRLYQVLGTNVTYSDLYGLPGLSDFGRSTSGDLFVNTNGSIYQLQDSLAVPMGRALPDTGWRYVLDRGRYGVVRVWSNDKELALVSNGRIETFSLPTLTSSMSWSISAAAGGVPSSNEVWVVFSGSRDPRSSRVDSVVYGLFDRIKRTWAITAPQAADNERSRAVVGWSLQGARGDTLYLSDLACADTSLKVWAESDRNACPASKVRTVIARLTLRGRIIADTVPAEIIGLHVDDSGVLGIGRFGGVVQLNARLQVQDTLLAGASARGIKAAVPTWTFVSSGGAVAMLSNGVFLRGAVTRKQ